jgi:hypothetical protein
MTESGETSAEANKGMKQTSVEHIGRSQLIPGVGPLWRSEGVRIRALTGLRQMRITSTPYDSTSAPPPELRTPLISPGVGCSHYA